MEAAGDGPSLGSGQPQFLLPTEPANQAMQHGLLDSGQYDQSYEPGSIDLTISPPGQGQGPGKQGHGQGNVSYSNLMVSSAVDEAQPPIQQSLTDLQQAATQLRAQEQVDVHEQQPGAHSQDDPELPLQWDNLQRDNSNDFEALIQEAMAGIDMSMFDQLAPDREQQQQPFQHQEQGQQPTPQQGMQHRNSSQHQQWSLESSGSQLQPHNSQNAALLNSPRPERSHSLPAFNPLSLFARNRPSHQYTDPEGSAAGHYHVMQGQGQQQLAEHPVQGAMPGGASNMIAGGSNTMGNQAMQPAQRHDSTSIDLTDDTDDVPAGLTLSLKNTSDVIDLTDNSAAGHQNQKRALPSSLAGEAW